MIRPKNGKKKKLAVRKSKKIRLNLSRRARLPPRRKVAVEAAAARREETRRNQPLSPSRKPMRQKNSRKTTSVTCKSFRT